MKNHIVILLFVLLTSCSVYDFKNITGFYKTKSGFEWGSSIKLKQDSSFIYNWQIGAIFGNETGTWKVKGNNLVLNSDIYPIADTTSNFYVLIKNKEMSQKNKFQLYYPDSTEALIGAHGLMINNNDTIFNSVSDITGLLTFPKHEYDSIKISFVGLKDITVPFSNNTYFKIVTVDYLISYMYEYFENEVWKIRGKHIIDKSKNKYYYEKKFRKIE